MVELKAIEDSLVNVVSCFVWFCVQEIDQDIWCWFDNRGDRETNKRSFRHVVPARAGSHSHHSRKRGHIFDETTTKNNNKNKQRTTTNNLYVPSVTVLKMYFVIRDGIRTRYASTQIGTDTDQCT